MPTISVVIPVHGVADYLERCLDSVLSQHPFEVIAVDDASPDDSPRILASRDVTVITNQTAQGPGRARELGAKQAAGDYIWFVDGDDELAPGAIAAVTEALSRLEPDVLLVDYENLYPAGPVTPSGGDLSGPELTTLARTPRLINLTMTVWSKLFRREFLAGLGVTFGPGIHEDVPVSATALLTARRIGVLNRVCYRYRRDRRSSFMAARSDRQWDILGAYQTIMSQRSLLTVPVRAAVFERAMWHYTTVLPLVPRQRRRAFFRQMTRDFRQWRPPEFRFPPGPRGMKLRLVAAGAYWTYTALEPLNRVRVAVARP
ncbi:MAG TPA: glycosyltransferase family 2 protein [Streptosporangiaceae bacterium]|nr:glycosyltransferase family 2 protein [Streptosporangiaceae bacterium]